MKSQYYNRSHLCSRCGQRLILASTTASEWFPDDEPFVEGVEDTLDEIRMAVSIHAYICEDCDSIEVAWCDSAAWNAAKAYDAARAAKGNKQ